jgi:hypothetical protein
MTAVFFWTHDVAAAPGRRGIRVRDHLRHSGRSEPPFDTLNLGGRLDDQASVEANRIAVASAFDPPRANACCSWTSATASMSPGPMGRGRGRRRGSTRS